MFNEKRHNTVYNNVWRVLVSCYHLIVVLFVLLQTTLITLSATRPKLLDAVIDASKSLVPSLSPSPSSSSLSASKSSPPTTIGKSPKDCSAYRRWLGSGLSSNGIYVDSLVSILFAMR